MSWRNICPMDEKVKFIAAIKEDYYSMSEICEKFGVNRKTGYKWLHIYENKGPNGLYAHSRARNTQNYKTSEKQIGIIVHTKQRFEHWGSKR